MEYEEVYWQSIIFIYKFFLIHILIYICVQMDETLDHYLITYLRHEDMSLTMDPTFVPA